MFPHHRWRLILLSPEEEDEISAQLAGPGWYHAVGEILSQDGTTPHLISPDDWRSLDQLMQRMVDLSDLAGRIDSAIDAGEIGNEESESEEGDEKMLDTHGAIPSEAPKLPSLPGVDMKWTIKPQLRTSTT